MSKEKRKPGSLCEGVAATDAEAGPAPPGLGHRRSLPGGLPPGRHCCVCDSAVRNGEHAKLQCFQQRKGCVIPYYIYLIAFNFEIKKHLKNQFI